MSMQSQGRAAARLAASVHGTNRGKGEHRATGTVEVPGEDVDDIYEPGTERAEHLCGRSHPAVHGCAVRGRQRVGDAAGRLRWYPCGRRNCLRGERMCERERFLDASDVVGRRSECGESV